MTDSSAATLNRPRLGVVVVSYASSALLEAALVPLATAGAAVVVVDNFSGAQERRRVRGLAQRHGWTLVEPAGNPGFGAGVNAGVRRAAELGCESYLLLNPDARVSAATARSLQQTCLADPLALVSPRLLDPGGRVVFAGSTLDLVDGRTRRLAPASERPDPRSRPVAWLTAACLAVHRDLWRLTGGFDETFFMYWEDVDLCYRALSAGGHLVLREDLTAVHDQGGTQGERRGRAKSSLYYYYNCRNRLRFGVRHLGARALVRWLRATPRVSVEILLRGGRRQLVGQPWLVWSAASGALAGAWTALLRLLRIPGPAARDARTPLPTGPPAALPTPLPTVRGSR